MTINNLTLPFPDFKYSETINPEEFDANNGLIKDKINEMITMFTNSGIGTSAFAYPTDLNNVTDSGFYYANGSTLNTPKAPYYYKVIVAGGNDVSQIAIGVGIDSVHYRTRNGSTWGIWMQIYGFGGWTPIALWTGFRPYSGGGTFTTPAAYRDSEGFVQLKGLVEPIAGQPNGVGSWIARLPSPFIPEQTYRFSCAHDSGSCNIQVTSDGTVEVQTAYSSYIFLDSIRFKGV
jgi:hypothetical protein